ncbi:5-oxoprolinase subunit B family protein [Nocardioides sambongensis]|uniref:5-oxoprolinase subunit B family protein n=1 Tax=Nocardioides sambongensis TaxID=2589074 RepID=UPI001E2B624B|nr:allophanate hydrolase subunit 1 [Nocardioides sambongensis]
MLIAARALRDLPVVADLVIDLVPAARTILLVTLPHVGPARLRDLLPAADRLVAAGAPAAERAAESAAGAVRIRVAYDGPDLEAVGELTGLGVAGVVAAHTTGTWQVAFCGFAPGFGYLVGGDPRLEVPRRETPRQKVPTGSVGLAGTFSGVYPRSSPGGWQLIGHTEQVLWDVEREPPALLAPGTRVRFIDADADADTDIGTGTPEPVTGIPEADLDHAGDER